jgi:hypothetical protein
MLEGRNRDPEIDVMEVTYADAANGRVRWRYEVLWSKSAGDPVHMVQRVYDANPWLIFQWSRAPGCTYGPGPLHMVMPDVRTANKMLEMIFQNAALALAGMYLIRDDGVLNPDNIQICSGGMIPVASTGGTAGASMVPLETNRDFNVSQIVLQQVQGAIKKGLYDSSLPPMDAQNRSATEIFARLRELAQDIGGAIGRLTSDLVGFVRRVLEVLQKRGVIPFRMRLDQFTLKIQINSPLAKSAALSEVENVVRWMQLVLELGGREAALVIANIEKIIAWIAEKLGVPSELIRSPDEQKKFRDDMMRAAASGNMVQQAA